MYNIKCIFRQTDKIIPLISNYSYRYYQLHDRRKSVPASKKNLIFNTIQYREGALKLFFVPTNNLLNSTGQVT